MNEHVISTIHWEHICGVNIVNFLRLYFYYIYTHHVDHNGEFNKVIYVIIDRQILSS